MSVRFSSFRYVSASVRPDPPRDVASAHARRAARAGGAAAGAAGGGARYLNCATQSRLSRGVSPPCRVGVRPGQTSDKPGHWPYHLSKENTLDYIATAAPVASRHTLHAISHSDSGLTRHKSIVCVTLGKDSTPRGAQLATVYL